MFNHTVTLFNLYVENGDYKYKRTILNGVHWESGEAVKLGDKSITTSNDTSLIVPFTNENYKNYKEPIGFKKDHTGILWTLQPEDIVAKEMVDIDINSIADLKGYNDVKTIASVDVIDYASIDELNNFTVNLK